MGQGPIFFSHRLPRHWSPLRTENWALTLTPSLSLSDNSYFLTGAIFFALLQKLFLIYLSFAVDGVSSIVFWLSYRQELHLAVLLLRGSERSDEESTTLQLL